MALIKYVGTSTIREVTIAQLERAGVEDHEDKNIYIDTREGGQRGRVVEVSDATAALLTQSEGHDWFLLTDEEINEVKAVDDSAEVKAARIAAAEQAERDEVEANKTAAAAERERLGLDHEDEDEDIPNE